MMKELLVGLIVAAVVVVGGLGYLLFFSRIDSKSAVSTSTISPVPIVTSYKKACDVFPQADANAILGAAAVKAASPSDVVTTATSVTTCTYTVTGANLQDSKLATVLVRASAADEAKSNFEAAKQSDAQPVSDLGVEAYWSPTYGQLNVLKGDNWAILSLGSMTPGSRTITGTEPLARLVLPRL